MKENILSYMDVKGCGTRNPVVHHHGDGILALAEGLRECKLL